MRIALRRGPRAVASTPQLACRRRPGVARGVRPLLLRERRPRERAAAARRAAAVAHAVERLDLGAATCAFPSMQSPLECVHMHTHDTLPRFGNPTRFGGGIT